ncbi:MAG TPA: hypothetical protein VNC50_19185, partial [Planctomycetia bacterium]|nr:hypothetical protein [Planctomycetia bacterium]
MSAGCAIPEDSAFAGPELPADSPDSPFFHSSFTIPHSTSVAAAFPPILPTERSLIDHCHGGDTSAFEERREFLAENMCRGDRPGLLTTYI